MSKSIILLPGTLLVGEKRVKKPGNSRGLAREERLQIMLSPTELAAVDNFRFAHRMPSRAAAVRELLRLGIASAGDTVTDNTGIKSADYGVVGEPKPRDHDAT